MSRARIVSSRARRPSAWLINDFAAERFARLRLRISTRPRTLSICACTSRRSGPRRKRLIARASPMRALRALAEAASDPLPRGFEGTPRLGMNGGAGYIRLPVQARPGKPFTEHSVAGRVRGLLRLMRPLNALMSAVAVPVGAVVAVGLAGVASRVASIAFGALAVFLFTGAGNALNDVFDRDVDRVNHPNRPIPAGEVSPGRAFDFALALFLAAVVASLLV